MVYVGLKGNPEVLFGSFGVWKGPDQTMNLYSSQSCLVKLGLNGPSLEPDVKGKWNREDEGASNEICKVKLYLMNQSH